MKRRRHQSGFTLIECMVYVLVMIVVVTMAIDTLIHCLGNSSSLQRNADDITRSLHAGERWRTDIRNAVAEPELIEGGVKIPQKTGAVIYTITDGTIWRQNGPGNTMPVLRGVKASAMHKDAHDHLTAWRWELELASPQKVVRVRPLFSFESVPASHP